MNRAFSFIFLGISTLFISCSEPESTDGQAEPEERQDTTTTTVDSLPSTEVIEEDPLPPENYKSSQFDKIGWELMDREAFGRVQVNMDSFEVVSVLGQPDSISPVKMWGADDGNHNEWIYPDKGITLGMNYIPSHPDKFYHKLRVDRMYLYSPSTYSTNRRISIGSPVRDVLKNYARAISDTTGYKSHLVAGSVYGGLMFKIEGDTVSNIFLGAAAE